MGEVRTAETNGEKWETSGERRDITSLRKILDGLKRLDSVGYQRLGKKYHWTVTPQNHNLILEEVMVLMMEALANHSFTIAHPLLNKKPTGALYIIVAQYLEDKGSASLDTYYNLVPTRTVALGWRYTQREEFKRLHQYAAVFPETQHLGATAGESVEKREFSKGAYSSYLKQGDTHSEGWVVRSIPVSEISALGIIEDHITDMEGDSKGRRLSKKVSVNFRVQENKTKGSLELFFDQKPNFALIQSLKTNGWRWHIIGKFWYNTDTPEARSYLNRLK